MNQMGESCNTRREGERHINGFGQNRGKEEITWEI
jgi:hypothetical protein